MNIFVNNESQVSIAVSLTHNFEWLFSVRYLYNKFLPLFWRFKNKKSNELLIHWEYSETGCESNIYIYKCIYIEIGMSVGKPPVVPLHNVLSHILILFMYISICSPFPTIIITSKHHSIHSICSVNIITHKIVFKWFKINQLKHNLMTS